MLFGQQVNERSLRNKKEISRLQSLLSDKENRIKCLEIKLESLKDELRKSAFSFNNKSRKEFTVKLLLDWSTSQGNRIKILSQNMPELDKI